MEVSMAVAPVAESQLGVYRRKLTMCPPKLLEKLLPTEQLEQAVQPCKITYRNRLFTPLTTVWIWARQRLSDKGRCREAVSHAIAWLMANQQRPASSDCSAYCQARKRQKLDFIEHVFHQSAESLDSAGTYAPLNRPVFLADATSCHVTDTPENRAAFRGPSGQKPGCGLPVVKILGLFNLASGAAYRLATDWTNASELGLFYSLWSTVPTGSLMVADSNFGNFMTIAGLAQRGVDCLMPVDQARKVDFSQCTKRLGPNDALFTWRHPKRCPWMDAEKMAAEVPETLTVRVFQRRVCRPGAPPETITLVTTLLDPQQYPAQMLTKLYARRWDIELDFRHIKTTLGMERIEARSPEMVRKEIYMYMVAYNLIRQAMMDASQHRDLPVDRISFKGTMDLVRSVGDVLGFSAPMPMPELYEHLLTAIAQRPARSRPGRSEPRVIKQRRNKYPYMKQARELYKQAHDPAMN